MPSTDPARQPLRFALIAWIVLMTPLALSACSAFSTTTNAATPTSLATATALGSTPTAAPTQTATAAPTETATDTLTPSATATATKRAVSVPSRTRPIPTPATPLGVFITAIKIDPTPAKSNEPPQFTVTFLNTTGKPQTYRWFVKIYAPNQPQSFGETSREDSVIAPNASQWKSTSDWKTTAVLECMSLIARVFWVDQNNQVIEFMKLNGSSPATGFNVCP